MKEIVPKLLAAMQDGDETSIRACLAQGFVFEDETAVATWDTDGFVDWALALSRAFPDLRLDALHQAGSSPLTVAVAMEGTHKDELDLTSLGAGHAPASGDVVRLAPQDLVFTLNENLIQSIVATDGKETGIGGLLMAVGMHGITA